jgi:hypothetical protein
MSTENFQSSLAVSDVQRQGKKLLSPARDEHDESHLVGEFLDKCFTNFFLSTHSLTLSLPLLKVTIQGYVFYQICGLFLNCQNQHFVCGFWLKFVTKSRDYTYPTSKPMRRCGVGGVSIFKNP